MTAIDRGASHRSPTAFRQWPSLGASVAVLASYLAVAAAMTFPLVTHLFSSDWLGVARVRDDVFNHVWNAWLLRSGELWATDGLFGRTDLLFSPRGFDLAFHTFNLFHMAFAGALGGAAGWVSGYNLAGFLLLPLAAWSAFQLALELTGDRWAAWFGGLAYGFLPWSLFHSALHPDLVPSFLLPLVVLSLVRAERAQHRWGWAVAGGVALGAHAYAGLYLLALGCLSVAAVQVATCLRHRRWRDRSWWLALAVFWIACALTLAPRVGPLFTADGDLGAVLAQKLDPDSGADLLRLLVPLGNPLFGYPARFRALEGPDLTLLIPLAPLALAIYGASGGRHRLAALGWLALALGFVALTLGPVLVFNGVRLESFPMPPPLGNLLPFPFGAFRDSKLYFPGVALPLALGAAHGLARLIGHGDSRHRATLVGVSLAALTLGECWLGPFRPADLSVNEFYRQLSSRPGRFALVELPFGRRAAKRYVYFQTVHGKPIQEGSISREPPEATGFVDGNLWLRTWRRQSGLPAARLDCSGLRGPEIATAASELVDRGFRFVIGHQPLAPGLAESFAAVPPIYRDADLVVWSVAAFAAAPPCRDPAGNP